MQERALARQGLTGFGWRGWCAVAVLIGLVAGVLGGFDPFILVLTALARAFGAEAPVKFVVYWLIWERMAMVAPSLSLVTVVV
ncbi:MAG: hypothetical protein KDA22_01180, partial [Phycisphaerales bacterium]|nr:hypothetical protein [Phycisphaerales bacterium]